MAFELPKLNYAFDALEPNIDAKTMEIHYGKHHNGYTNNLNNIISGTDNEGKSIEDILNSLDLENKGLRNNGGGYYNHNLFWEIMGPNGGGEPTGEIGESINSNFGSFENFKDEFHELVQKKFLELARKYDNRYRVINADNNKDFIFNEIIDQIKHFFSVTL